MASDSSSTASAPKSTLYTRTGDAGTSALFSGTRRDKNDAAFQALGAIDELSAAIGVAREYCVRADNGLNDRLQTIQSRLIDLMSSVATPLDEASAAKRARVSFAPDNVPTLEGWIDELDSKLPPLSRFILPSGGLASAHLHMARTICRRAEREVVPLMRADAVEESVNKYLNRLSDFLFAAARTAAHHEGIPEVAYRKGEAPQ